MSEFFDTIKVATPEIVNCTDKLTYAIQSGPAEASMNVFRANTVSNSNIAWNVNIPSPNLVIDRKFYVEATMAFQINIGVKPANLEVPDATTLAGAAIATGQQAFLYGEACALNSFPFNNLIQTGSLTINNSSVSMQVQSILPVLMRSMAIKHLAEFNGDTPVLSDRYYCNYDDMFGSASNNLFDDFNSSNFADAYVSPRGEFPIKFTSIIHGMQAANADADTPG